MRSKGLFALALFSLFLLSCAKRQTLAPPPYEGPINSDVLKNAVLFEGFKSLVGEADVKVMKGGKKLATLKGVFAYMSPDSMGLRVFDPFGFTVFEMIASGNAMQVLLPGSDALYEGEVPSIGPMSSGALYGIEWRRDGYTLYAFKPGEGGPPGDLELARKYFFSRSLRNTGMNVYKDGTMFVGMGFGEFSDNIPTKITLTFFNGFSAEIRLLGAEVDGEIPAEYFEPFGHEGRQVLPLESLYKMEGF